MGVGDPCPCGSGEPCRELADGRGIYCCLVCDSCEDEKRRGYRVDIMTTPYTQLDVDEPIEPLDGD